MSCSKSKTDAASGGAAMNGAIKFVLAVVVVTLLFIGYATAAPTWTDKATGLMWAKDSTSSDVTWNEASNYCSNLRLAGYSNWRLATIDELAGISDNHTGKCRLYLRSLRVSPAANFLT
jgi:hypothetical protein